MRYLILAILLVGCGKDSKIHTAHRSVDLICSYGECQGERIYCKRIDHNKINCNIIEQIVEGN